MADPADTAREAIAYVRGGDSGPLPAGLAALTPQARDEVLQAARRVVDADARRVVDVLVDQLAATYRQHI